MMNEHIYKSAIDKLKFSDDLNVKTLKYLDSKKETRYSKSKRISRKRFYFGLTALTATLVLAISISMFNNNPDTTVPNDSGVHVDTSSSYPAYSLEDLVMFSDIIAVGEVKAISEPIEIKPVGGGDSDFFTDYTIKLKETYKDTSKITNGVTESVPLRIRTGKPGIAVSTDFDYDFKIGDRYLFFLSYPTSGGGYTVDDDHISLVGGPQGLLKITSEDVFNSKFFDILEIEELISIINDPNIQKAAEEFDPLSGLKENLKSGFITQEEYDRVIKDLSEYAEIVSD